MTRPAWTLMNKLPMYSDCQCGSLENAEWLEQRMVNIPSSYRRQIPEIKSQITNSRRELRSEEVEE